MSTEFEQSIQVEIDKIEAKHLCRHTLQNQGEEGGGGHVDINVNFTFCRLKWPPCYLTLIPRAKNGVDIKFFDIKDFPGNFEAKNEKNTNLIHDKKLIKASLQQYTWLLQAGLFN